MKSENIRRLSLSAMFLSIALLIPFLTGQIPEVGNMLLPMHLPVMLCGLICGAKWGTAVGLCAPLLRSLIFGKPILFPSAIAMSFELAVYGLVIGMVFSSSRHKCIFSLYGALISSMICGRIAWGVAMAALMGFNGFTLSLFFGEAVVNAIPGIVLQLLLIPTVMLLLRKTHVAGLSVLKKTPVRRIAKSTDDILKEIQRIYKHKGRVTVAVDGRCASGKTVFVNHLSERIEATVFHTDDFFLPRDMRTDERLSEAGGNFHRERFLEEVLIPISNGASVEYRRYDCSTDTVSTPKIIPRHDISIIEGAYSMHPELRKYYDLKIFFDVSKQTQKARITERDGARADTFFKKWIPLEEDYIKLLSIKESCDIVVNADDFKL